MLSAASAGAQHSGRHGLSRAYRHTGQLGQQRCRRHRGRRLCLCRAGLPYGAVCRPRLCRARWTEEWPCSKIAKSVTGLGALVFAWIDTALGFRWIFWILMISESAALLPVLLSRISERRACRLGVFLLCRDSRASRAGGSRKTAHTIDRQATRGHQLARLDPASRHPGSACVQASHHLSLYRACRLRLWAPFAPSLSPLSVTSVSLFIGVLWGCVFGFFSSVPYVFVSSQGSDFDLSHFDQAQYGFSNGEVGTVFAGVVVGGILGMPLVALTDRLYQRDRRRSPTGRAPPESRLYTCAVGGIIAPMSYFMFAWTGQPSLPWILPVIGLSLFNFAVFPIVRPFLQTTTRLTFLSSIWPASPTCRNAMAPTRAAPSLPSLYLEMCATWAVFFLPAVDAF